MSIGGANGRALSLREIGWQTLFYNTRNPCGSEGLIAAGRAPLFFRPGDGSRWSLRWAAQLVGDGLAEERGVTGVVAMGFKNGTKIQGEGIA
jgi:hypothetical protein